MWYKIPYYLYLYIHTIDFVQSHSKVTKNKEFVNYKSETEQQYLQEKKPKIVLMTMVKVHLTIALI
jgi:hypothetical protein